MKESIIAHVVTTLLVILAIIAIASSALDLRCITMRPSNASVVIVCSANRLEAHK